MTAVTTRSYDIATDTILFNPGQKFSVHEVGSQQTPWWNRTLCAVNDSWVRLGVMEGDFHWHKHDDTDEFFMVIEGRLDIELQDRTIELGVGQAFTVPKGVMHFPHAYGRTVVLMIERAGVVPTGN